MIQIFQKVDNYEGWVVCNNLIPFLREYFEKVADANIKSLWASNKWEEDVIKQIKTITIYSYSLNFWLQKIHACISWN